MPDENKKPEQEQPELQPAPQPTPAPAETGEKTFTQADIDRIVADRLSRERKQAEEKAKAEAEKAKLDAEQRAKVEKAEAEQKAAEAEQKATMASYRADLKGEVVDVSAALKLVDTEKHVKDGTVDIKAFLKDFPFLAKAKATAPSGGGGTQDTPSAHPLSSLSAAMEADKRGNE